MIRVTDSSEGMSKPPEFAVVVVNWNGGTMVVECVESVLRTKQDLAVEIVVVDNRSSDGSPDLIRKSFPEVTVIDAGANVGFGRACNLGVAATTGKYILFLNPDAMLQANALQTIADFFAASPSIAGIGSKVRSPEGEIQELGIQRDPTPLLEFVKLFASGSKLLPRKDPSVSGPVTKLYGACLCVRRDFLPRIGEAFDDRFFMYCEDVDICRRIRECKGSLYYLAEAEIVHNQGSCSKKAPSGFSVLMQCESLSKYMVKYHGMGGAALYRFLMFVGTSLRAIALAIMLVAARIRKESRVAALKRKFFRNNIMLAWSCFMRKPFIPE